MAKTIITIDDDLLDYIKSDAAKERRSMAGQICKLIELSREYGGYEGLVKRLAVQESKGITNNKLETRGRKRSRPQKITWDSYRGGSSHMAILYNADADKALIIKADNPESAVVAAINLLKSGKFPIAEVQSDYSDKCCKFEVLSGFGNTIEDVRNNCDAAEFYGEIYDCVGNAEVQVESSQPDIVQSVSNLGGNIPTLSDVLAIKWECMSHQQTLLKYLTICKNPEVRELAEAYIDEQYAPEDEIEPETIFGEDAAIIMTRFCEKYKCK